MSPRRIAAGRGRWLRAILVLAGASACLGAVAYAAIQPKRPAAGERLLKARFLEVPEASSNAAEPTFRFHVPPRAQGDDPSSQPGRPGRGRKSTRHFQCRLDSGVWETCESPYHLGGLAAGEHFLAVRAFNRDDRAGPAASYTWRQMGVATPLPAQEEPKQFTIEARDVPTDLYPGDPAQPLPLLIANPNPVAIEITSIEVDVADGSSNCTAENFALTAAGVSPAAPLTVPANGSVSLPAETAPTIAMLNLPVNQDACQGAAVPLDFSGEAHG
ncbi:MAG TPA: hypothetical protein VFX45_06785 [Solirubrobacterales bacterium]|nr:hypothetical protein [Solirubrobacterales bacterium]